MLMVSCAAAEVRAAGVSESVTFTLKVEFVPAGPVGVPVITPAELNARPAGSVVPPDRLHVNVPVPPDSLSEAE